jgi:hypothetical protein
MDHDADVVRNDAHLIADLRIPVGPGEIQDPVLLDIRATTTSGWSITTPNPSPATPRIGSLPNAFDPASITACPGTDRLTTVASTVRAQSSHPHAPSSAVVRSL